MGIGPSQTKLPPSALAHRASYGGSIVHVLAPILGGSAANGLRDIFLT
jgi:hypothetical protein